MNRQDHKKQALEFFHAIVKQNNIGPDDNPFYQTQVNPGHRRPDIDAWVERQGVSILVGGNQPVYLSREHVIKMPPFEKFKSTDAYYATLFHELAHSTMSELGRWPMKMTPTGPVVDDAYGFIKQAEEIVAECAAVFLCKHFKLDDTVRNAKYVWMFLLELCPSGATAAKAADVFAVAAKMASDAAMFLHGRGVDIGA